VENRGADAVITGEEERYSHLDLLDLAANVDGAHAAFEAARPLVAARDAKLAEQIDRRFADVADALRSYRRGDGFVRSGELRDDDTRALSRVVDALAEPLSRVGAIVVTQGVSRRPTRPRRPTTRARRSGCRRRA
jgi:iron uptake system component EfeO